MSTTSSKTPGPIIDSQVDSGDAIARWSHNLNILAAQSAENDQYVQSILTQAAPTADQVNAVFGDVRESLPQTLANLEIVLDMLKRYHKGVEQLLVAYPQGAAEGQTVTAAFPGYASLGTVADDQPAPAVSDRLSPGTSVAVSGGHQPGADAIRNVLQDPARHSGQRRARGTQPSVCRCPR